MAFSVSNLIDANHQNVYIDQLAIAQHKLVAGSWNGLLDDFCRCRF